MDKEVISNFEKSSTSEEVKINRFNFMKLFSGKYLKVIILVIVGIVALILFLNLDNPTSEKKTTDLTHQEYQNTMQYCSDLENKLVDILSQIKGAGNVSVMLTVDGSPELVYANESDSKYSSNNGSSTTSNSSSPINVQTSTGSSPLILTENLPKVKGVIVVSSGASDVSIKLDILNAVSTLLDISTEKISVLKGI